MKRIIIVLVLALVILCAWLVHRYGNSALRKDGQEEISAVETTNVVMTETTAPSSSVFPTTAWIRPSSISEDMWDRLMAYRQQVLERNQPVEFYARVVDQDARPVEGANTMLKLLRVDEQVFATTNFFHMQMGDENKPRKIELLSDAKGWLQVTGVTGYSIDVNLVEKEGYISQYTNRYHGGVHYEPGGRRNPSADILMTNALNPAQGYTFHLWKKGTTEPVVQWKQTYRITRDVAEQSISLFPTAADQSSHADLVLKTWLAYPEAREGDRMYERWIALEAAPDAAIQETTMAYPYAAPLNGYGRDFRFLYQRGTREGEGWTRKFYVKARDGKVFASFIAKFSSAAGLTLQLDTIVNPNGSPVLEPDAAKQIADPEEILRIDESARIK